MIDLCVVSLWAIAMFVGLVMCEYRLAKIQRMLEERRRDR
jgi:hypothetical protein